MKNLGEASAEGHQKRVDAGDQEGEQQMFETFVKEKATLLGYVHDMIRFAAKLQDIDLEQQPGSSVLPQQEDEEMKTDGELRIKNTRECCLIGTRIHLVLEKYQEQSSVLDTILEAFISPIMRFLQIYVRKAATTESYDVPTEVKALFLVLC